MVLGSLVAGTIETGQYSKHKQFISFHQDGNEVATGHFNTGGISVAGDGKYCVKLKKDGVVTSETCGAKKVVCQAKCGEIFFHPAQQLHTKENTTVMQM